MNTEQQRASMRHNVDHALVMAWIALAVLNSEAGDLVCEEDKNLIHALAVHPTIKKRLNAIRESVPRASTVGGAA